jgi:uncharacterized protein (DUF58 family)
MTTSGRTLRLVTLVVPMLVVVLLMAASSTAPAFVHVASFGLFALWFALAIALVVRFVGARSTNEMPAPDIAHIDILTAGGTAMMWTGTTALVAAAIVGWASLSVIGVLGIGVVQLSALWTLVVAVGQGPWREARVIREVVPAVAVEGEALREQLRLVDVRVPSGMRLFIVGRAQRHGIASRYVVAGRDAGREVRLESDIGPALRGEHRAPALAMWFGDVLGLARTTVVHLGETSFRVLPKPAVVDGAPVLLGAGGEAAIARPTPHAPTEGTFRIREYVPGDDARRIHWVRSLQHLSQNELIVRLPDEVPPADPQVRLVLDNEMPAIVDTSGRTADELLDTLVRLWLGLGKALATGGTRVTLVTAAPRDRDEAPRVVERRVDGRSMQAAVALGASITWQSAVSLEALLRRQSQMTQIIVTCRPRYAGGAKHLRWVLVPETLWTTLDATPVDFFDNRHELPYPVGSPENRKTRRLAARTRTLDRWDAASTFSDMLRWGDWKRFSGGFVALPQHGRPDTNRAAVEVIP